MLAAPHRLSPARGLMKVAGSAEMSRDRIALGDVERDEFESPFFENATDTCAVDAFVDLG